MLTRAEKVDLFRAMHRPGAPIVMPNIWSAGTAKAMAGAGFDAIATTSAGLALEHGVRDGEMGRQASLQVATSICAAVDIPVSADLENGFHDEPVECGRVMEAAIRAGLAGASIEDATGRKDQPIYPFDHAVERVRQSVAAARAAGGLVVTARAENFLHGRLDLEDTIARLKAFEAAGADVLFAPGLPDLDAVRAVCTAVSRPVSVIVYPGGAGITAPAVADAGVARISLAGSLARLAHEAIVTAATSVSASLSGGPES